MKLSSILLAGIAICSVAAVPQIATKAKGIAQNTVGAKTAQAILPRASKAASKAAPSSSAPSSAATSATAKSNKTPAGKVSADSASNGTSTTKKTLHPTISNKKMGPITIRDIDVFHGLVARQESFGKCKHGLKCGQKGWDWMDLDSFTQGVATWCYQVGGGNTVPYKSQLSAQVNGLQLVDGSAGMLTLYYANLHMKNGWTIQPNDCNNQVMAMINSCLGTGRTQGKLKLDRASQGGYNCWDNSGKIHIQPQAAIQ